jgi:hypothetical protein
MGRPGARPSRLFGLLFGHADHSKPALRPFPKSRLWMSPWSASVRRVSPIWCRRFPRPRAMTTVLCQPGLAPSHRKTSS